MKAVELLDSLCYVNNEYLISAEGFREGKRKKIRFTRKKAILLAAAIVAALLLVGCAVAVVVSLQNKKFGETTSIRFFDDNGKRIAATEVTVDLIAVNGTRDTPQYKAVKEWYEWNESYDPDINELPCGNEQGIPDNLYYTYDCSTWEMANKLTEILEKYDLKPLDTFHAVQTEELELFRETFSIPSLCHEDGKAEFQYFGGIVYGVCAWEFPMDVTLENGKTFCAEMTYVPKDYFLYDIASVKLEAYEEWSYTTADGSPVWIAMGSQEGIIFREQENAYISVSVDIPLDAKINQEAEPITRETAERLADLFNFTLTPTVPENPEEFLQALQEAQNRRIARQKETMARLQKEWEERHNFDNYADYLMENHKETVPDGYYALWDLDGDGVEELLYADSQGLFHNADTIQDGKVGEYYRGGVPFHVCENGILEMIDIFDTKTLYRYCAHSKQDNTALESVSYYMDKDQWYYSEGTSYEYTDPVPVTQTDAEAVRAKYPRIEIPVYPLKDYPVDDQGTTLEAYITRDWVPTTEEDAIMLYRALLEQEPKEGEEPYTHYRLQDLDGNGIPELFVGWDGDHFDDIYTAENRRTRRFQYYGSQLCGGDLFLYEHRNLPAVTYEFWKMEKGRWVRVDLLKYRYETEIWGLSTDGDLGFEKIITEAEAQAFLDSHKPLSGFMKPISDFPAK